MLSPSDTILIFVIALLLFGPEHLPKIARQLGDAMRHVQTTTNSFMAEMERAAAASDRPAPSTFAPPPDSAPAQEPDVAKERALDESFELELPGAPTHAQDAHELPETEPPT